MDDQSSIADPDPVATAVKELTTAPLRLVVDVDGEFGDFGIYDLYEEAANTLTERVEHARVMLIRGAATPAEQARMADIEAVLTGGFGGFVRHRMGVGLDTAQFWSRSGVGEYRYHPRPCRDWVTSV